MNPSEHSMAVNERSFFNQRILNMLQAGAEDKQKSYCAVCELPCKVTAEVLAKLTSSQELPIKQFTPQRVAHRYALAAPDAHTWHDVHALDLVNTVVELKAYLLS